VSQGETPQGPWPADAGQRIGLRVERAIVGALRGQDLSGFEIWRWLGSEHGTEGLLTEPDLYPLLYRLEAERILESDWQEAERIRRKYRLTATALAEADAHGWPALALRDECGTVIRPARSHSPDPDAGTWFVPPKPEPLEPAEAGPTAAVAALPEARWDRQTTNPTIASFEEALGTKLDLPRPEAARVRQEIVDHLADAANAFEHEGVDPAAATARAIDHLGNPAALAARIVAAQQTPQRRGRAYRWAVAEMALELVIWLTLGVAILSVTSGVVDILVSLAGRVGLHVAVIRSSQWATNQVAIMLCIGAFAAGRQSLGQLARISHHSDAALRKRWAIGGAAVVLVLALLLPGYQDALVVATLLAAPLAFVAGTFRPTHANESAYTWRALGQAAVLVLAVMFLPLTRLFVLDLGGTPGIPAAADGVSGRLTINEVSEGRYTYEASTSGGGSVSVEIWPAVTEGLFVQVDPSAEGPAVRVPSSATPVDLSTLPAYAEWWVVAVRTSPDGQLSAVAVEIQPGVSPDPGTALGWLLAHL
jgi:hypothetical protein